MTLKTINAFSKITVIGFSLFFIHSAGTQASALEKTKPVNDSIGAYIEKYFTDLVKNLDKASNSPIVKGTKIKPIDRFFVLTLKKHQTIHSILRTNSKGIVISEVIRGQIPAAADKRNISNQQWFSQIKKKNENYYDVIKNEETGRYYLFWAKAVMSSKAGSKEHPIGVLVAQIDLWDCFHKIAVKVDQPFLIRLNKLSLYSNKWEKVRRYTEEPLNIPGVTKISLCYIRKNIEENSLTETKTRDTVADTGVKNAPVVAAKDTTLQQQPQVTKDKQKPKKKSNFIVIILCIAIIVVFFIVLVKFISWYKTKMQENKDDIL